MIYRSTNARFVHYGGDVTAAVESSHGVQLTGGSTGGIVQAVGDDTDITLTVRGKGAGGVVLGSGVPFKGSFSQNSTYSHGAIGASRTLDLTFASTTVDVNTGDLLSIGLLIATTDMSSVVGIASYRLSTVATSRLTVVLGNYASTATSTGSGTLQLAWLDLT